MATFTIRGVPISFPFEPYSLQKDYMEKVIECLQNECNGVLESPTGTGKTLSLLCSSLGWLKIKKVEMQEKYTAYRQEDPEENYRNTLQAELNNKASSNKNNARSFMGVPTIIYASRTHSQLSQCMQELKRTAYNNMKATILGSRDQLCIHPELINENRSNKILMCRMKVKTRSCHFYNRVENQKNNPNIQQNNIIDIEDLVKIGQTHKFCPYYMAKELNQQSDIVFMPYNYLLDPLARKALGVELANNIIILDEAHNIEKICEDSASLQIKTTDVALCIEEVTEVMKAVSQDSTLIDNYDVPKDLNADSLCILKQMLLDLEKAIDEIKVVNVAEGITFDGNYIFDILNKAGITDSNCFMVIGMIDNIVQFLATIGDGPFQRRGNGLELIGDLLRIVFAKRGEDFKNKIKKCYRVHVKVEEPKKKTGSDNWLSKATIAKNGCKVLNYWCFSPGFGMNMLMDQGVRCVILTSGTLAPLAPLISELELNIKVCLENPHVVTDKQVCVKILTQGPDMEILNCNFQNRNNPKYLSSLGNTILNLTRITPNGLLIFFPSYPVLQNCIEHWQQTGIWTNINQHKAIFVEPKEKDAFNTAMKDYYERIQNPDYKGAIFMGVCRGKVSEGLDFADMNGRAVIIIGLPYPPLKDPRVILKRRYLDVCNANNKEYLKGEEWYSLEASRSVNQAIGRVIRHQNDYGAIILLDTRFTSSRIRNQMSMWLRNHIKVINNFGEIIRDVKMFFRNAEINFPVQTKAISRPAEFDVPVTYKPRNFDFSTSPVCSSSSEINNKREREENLLKKSKKIKVVPNNCMVLQPISNNNNPTEIEIREYILMVKKALQPVDFQQFVNGITLYKNDTNFDELIKCLDDIFLKKVSLRYVIRGLEPFIKDNHKDSFNQYWEKIKC